MIDYVIMSSLTIDAGRRARLQEIVEKDRAQVAHDIAVIELTAEATQLSMPVTPECSNGLGLCHGGMIYFLADTAVGVATNTEPGDDQWVTASATITHLAPARVGDTLRARCTLSAAHGRSRVYTTEVRSGGHIVAVSQATMMRTRGVASATDRA